MQKVSGIFWGAVVAAFLFALAATMSSPGVAQPPASGETEPAPPAGQKYTGSKRCAACHLKEYLNWKKTKHAEAFTAMPAKYRRDAECLACHVTGYDATGGHSDGTAPEVLQNLLSVSCEACHGPGSKHEEVSKPFINKKKLAPEEKKVVLDSIWKVAPHNICSGCHVEQSHKEHPQFDKQ